LELKLNSEEKIVPDAFHGTCADSADDIKKEGKFKGGKRTDYYLGDGVYFYESSCWHARKWAEDKCSNMGKEWVVFRVTLSLKNCLDLHDRNHVLYVKDFAEKMKGITGEDANDTTVLNFCCFKNTKICSIRATYSKLENNKPIFKMSRFLDHNQLIICIKDISRIISFIEEERKC